jgi:hypothetical protein
MEKVKNFVSLLKDSLLLALFVLLLFFPTSFNNIFTKAGFTEGSLMGFTWKEKAMQAKAVADSSQKLAKVASEQIDLMQQHLDSISKKVADIPKVNQSTQSNEIAYFADSSKKKFSSFNTQFKFRLESQNKKLDALFSQ